MGIDQSHQRKESIVGNAENADAAIAFRNVLHQPINGVKSVGGMIDRGRILRAVQRAGHDVIPFRAMFATDILHDADIPSFDNDFGGVVISLENGREMGTLGVAG